MNDNQKGSVFHRLLPALLLGAVIAFLLVMETTRYSEIRRLRDRTNVLQEDVQEAQRKADAALSAVIAPQTLTSAQASVYLIVVNGFARGTAFVIDRDAGILATAAHTAASLPLDDPNASVYLLNRGTPHPIAVKTKRLHAGFGAFRALVEDYQPIRSNSSIYAPQAAPLRDLAFDAGLIFVDALDSETGENRLGPELKIASEEKLLALTAGAPIAVIGYPYDTLDDGFAPDAGIPRVERGVIAAMTPPLDSALETPDPVTANLIIHRLSTAGGNSGSPILDAEGEVIGIHTHGIESTSSNADGAAQRAEVLFDLQSTEREESRLQNIFYPAWRRMLTHWSPAEAVMPWSFYMEYARPGETPAPLVRDFDTSNETPYARDIERINFEPEAQSRLVEAADLNGASVSGDDGIEKNNKGFTIREKGEYAEIWRSVNRRQDNVLFAFDYSLRSKRGFCPLTTYYRKKGETRLRVLRNRASFELHLEPAGNVIEDYQIIIRRDSRCDPVSAEFFLGVIGWPIISPPSAQTVSFNPDGTSRTGSPSAHVAKGEKPTLVELRDSVSKFFTCRTSSRDLPESCLEPEYLELD